MVGVFASHVFAIGSEIVAGRGVDVPPAHEEQYVTIAGPRGRSDDVSAATGHVPGGAVPLLPSMRLEVLQVKRVAVVQQQRLPSPRGHVDGRRAF